MRFRLHNDRLHVHGCPEHARGCDFFDHAPQWLIGSREAARSQLSVYRISIVTRITALTVILQSIDAMLHRLDTLST